MVSVEPTQHFICGRVFSGGQTEDSFLKPLHIVAQGIVGSMHTSWGRCDSNIIVGYRTDPALLRIHRAQCASRPFCTVHQQEDKGVDCHRHLCIFLIDHIVSTHMRVGCQSLSRAKKTEKESCHDISSLLESYQRYQKILS